MNLRIFIVIPPYRHSVQLLRTIHSVHNQTERNWEVFFMDDKSHDSAWRIAQMVSYQDHRIHCERNRHKLAISQNYWHASIKEKSPYFLSLTTNVHLDQNFLSVNTGYNLNLNVTAELFPTWALNHLTDHRILLGPVSQWHDTLSGHACYLVDGFYQRVNSGSYRMIVNQSSTTPVTIEIWNDTGSYLLRHDTIIPTSGTSLIGRISLANDKVFPLSISFLDTGCGLFLCLRRHRRINWRFEYGVQGKN